MPGGGSSTDMPAVRIPTKFNATPASIMATKITTKAEGAVEQIKRKQIPTKLTALEKDKAPPARAIYPGVPDGSPPPPGGHEVSTGHRSTGPSITTNPNNAGPNDGAGRKSWPESSHNPVAMDNAGQTNTETITRMIQLTHPSPLKISRTDQCTSKTPRPPASYFAPTAIWPGPAASASAQVARRSEIS